MKAIGQRGASAVEFAIILPLLVVITFGIIEFGIYIYDKAMITNASREGARAGVIYRTDSNGDPSPLTPGEITAIVNNYLAGKLVSFGSSTVTLVPAPTTAPCPAGAGDTCLTVTVAYNYHFLIMPSFISPPSNITAATVMRMEQ